MRPGGWSTRSIARRWRASGGRVSDSCARSWKSSRAALPSSASPAGSSILVRPAADPSDVEMHEILVRIVADAAGLHVEGDLMRLGQLHPVEADIDGLALHVQAVLGDEAALLSQRAVGVLRPVAAHDFIGAAIARALLERIEQIEQADVDVMHRVVVTIAEEVVDLIQRGRQVLALLEERSDEVFFAPARMQRQYACRRLGGRRRIRTYHERAAGSRRKDKERPPRIGHGTLCHSPSPRKARP